MEARIEKLEKLNGTINQAFARIANIGKDTRTASRNQSSGPSSRTSSSSSSSTQHMSSTRNSAPTRTSSHQPSNASPNRKSDCQSLNVWDSPSTQTRISSNQTSGGWDSQLSRNSGTQALSAWDSPPTRTSNNQPWNALDSSPTQTSNNQLSNDWDSPPITNSGTQPLRAWDSPPLSSYENSHKTQPNTSSGQQQSKPNDSHSIKSLTNSIDKFLTNAKVKFQPEKHSHNSGSDYTSSNKNAGTNSANHNNDAWGVTSPTGTNSSKPPWPLNPSKSNTPSRPLYENWPLTQYPVIPPKPSNTPPPIPPRPSSEIVSPRQNQTHVARPASSTYNGSVVDVDSANLSTPIPRPDECLTCRDFSVVDAHAANFPRLTVRSIQNLALDLTSRFPLKTDKARAIFIWLHHNVAYNVVALFSNNVKCQTPQETLQTGLAVCQGYAELFAELARYSGLESKVVSGHGKGYGYVENTDGRVPPYTSNHAWNAVRLDSSEWHLIDTCWGAGHTDNSRQYIKKLGVTHFTSTPEQFRLRHFPTNPEFQFCQMPMSWEEYIMMKERGPEIFGEFKDQGFSEVTVQPALKTIRATSSPNPVKFMITTKCKHTRIAPRDQYVLLLFIDGNYNKCFQVDQTNRIWTCELATASGIRPGSRVSAYYLDTFGGKNAKGTSIQEYVRLRTSKAQTFKGLCEWEVL